MCTFRVSLVMCHINNKFFSNYVKNIGHYIIIIFCQVVISIVHLLMKVLKVVKNISILFFYNSNDDTYFITTALIIDLPHHHY